MSGPAVSRLKLKWYVQFVVDDSYWQLLNIHDPVRRYCWTYKGAMRLARRWNRRNQSAAGVFEVFGPEGKEA